MPNFDDIFSQQSERPVKYKDKLLVRFDDLLFKDGDKFLIHFEKTNSKWLQGVTLDILGSFEIKGKIYPNKIVLWNDPNNEEILLIAHEEKAKKPSSKRLPEKGMLGIKNVWNTGTGSIESWYGGAAMIVEEIEDGRRYRCNDGVPDDDFDDIIFTVRNIGNIYKAENE